MENKYYTPDIEDIRIGYKCEIYQKENSSNSELEWVNQIISNLHFLDIITKMVSNKHIRVSYLTKEQIEAEGWNHSYDDFTFGEFWKERDSLTDYHLSYDYKSHTMSIGLYSKNNIYTYGDVYVGNCSSINELKTIIKLTNGI